MCEKRLFYETSVTADRDIVVRRNTVGWFDSIEHNRWLSANMQALLAEAEGAIVPTGFAHLDAEGKPDPTRSIDLAVTGRMAYVFSLGVLMGLPGMRRYADHAIKALSTYFVDPVNGGMWVSIKPEPGEDGHGVPWDEAGRVKSQYHTVYALLGAAAAAVANRPGAHELLEAMLAEQKEYWADDYGLVWDQYDEAFTEPVPVHTLGTLIHTIEAMDADVISIETARSGNELLKIFRSVGYKQEVGPGVYDIHSPRIPSVHELVSQIRALLEVLPKEQLWINPDCGLKTRKWEEVEPSLKNMVEAVRIIRAEV